MNIKPTNHSYRCELTNYNGDTTQIYHSWEDFKIAYDLDNIDMDYNYLFRYDIMSIGELYLYYMQQRRGKFVPVVVCNITPHDIPEINEYIDKCRTYIKNLWEL